MQQDQEYIWLENELLINDFENATSTKSCQNKNKKFFKTKNKTYQIFSNLRFQNSFGKHFLRYTWHGLISTFGKSFVMVSIFPLILLFCLCFPTAMSSLFVLHRLFSYVLFLFLFLFPSALICYKFNALCIGPTCGTRQGQTLALQQFLFCACTHTHTHTHPHTHTHTI